MDIDPKYLIGGGAVVGVLVIRAIVNFLTPPSLNDIAKTSSKSIPQMGDDDKLTIWGYEAGDSYVAFSTGMTDSSYYVSRVEAYCRAAKVPYTKLESKGGSENPRGKVPFANVHGTMTDESGKIIDLVKKHASVDLDKDLTAQQLVQGHYVRQTIQGSLYWVMAHFLFHTVEGRKVFRKELALILPPVVSSLIAPMALRNMHNNLHGQGMGRMPEPDIVAAGLADMKALSTTLGKNDFILGTKTPTSYDCDMYALLAVFFGHPFFAALPFVVQVQKEYPNLDAFFQRLRGILYPELKTKAA